jgi:hypothetical protein
MATVTIKSTYSLDVGSVRQLETMARRWKVSKSEALRRAIRAAAEREPEAGRDELNALDRLQASLNLTKDQAARWERASARERRDSGGRLKKNRS